MKISKVREVKTPSRGTVQSAGIDFFIPKFNKQFIDDFYNANNTIEDSIKIPLPIGVKTISLGKLEIKGDKIIIPPLKTVKIPLGIHIKFDDNNVFMLKDKSGLSTSTGLKTTAGIIDSDYQGEIVAALFNSTINTVVLTEESKVVQGILIPICIEQIEELEFKDLYLNKSERGDGGFGSTGLI